MTVPTIITHKYPEKARAVRENCVVHVGTVALRSKEDVSCYQSVGDPDLDMKLVTSATNIK